MKTNNKFQSPINLVKALDNSIINGGLVTSPLYDSKKALKLINDMRSFGYSINLLSLYIEDIDRALEDGDTTLLINSLQNFELEKNHFLSFKRKLKKLGFETLEKHEQILLKCCAS